MPESSATTPDDGTDRDRQLEAVLAEYIRACETGLAPNRREILESHPELMDELQGFFANRDRMDRFAEPIFPDFPTQRSRPVPETIQYFGDYEVVEEIGRGGMGVIYKARQVSLDRIIAIKMMMDGRLGSAQDVQRFRVEAEAAASLDHPNIVPIYEVGEHNGRHYFSMKLIEGGSLSQHTAKGSMPPREAVALMAKVTRAVHYAHQRGILHRDLKPANILLDAVGQPLVTDFGLAKRLERESELTETGAVLGTPSYMAPEQASGQSRSLTTATDVYGLGAVLFSLLAGRPPFVGEDALDILAQVRDREATRPGMLNPLVDRDLDTICLKSLEKNPQHRYDSADSLADDLERWLGYEPIRARPSSRLERGLKWARRKPAVAALTAVSIAATVVLIAGLIVSNVLITREQAETKRLNVQLAHEQRLTQGANIRLTKEQAETKVALDRESKALADRTMAYDELDVARKREQRTAYARGIALVKQEWIGNKLQRADDYLEECNLEELRGWEWRFLRRLCNRPGIFAEPGHGGVGSVPMSQDGRLLAVVRGDAVVLLDAMTGEVLRSFSSESGPILCVAMSPDGQFLAAAGHTQPQVWNAETGEVHAKLPPLAMEVRSLSFNSDATRLVAAVNEYVSQPNGGRAPHGRFVVWDLPAAKELQTILRTGTSSADFVTFAPQGRRFAGVHGSIATIWDADTGEENVSLGLAATVAWSSDGKLLAAVNGTRATVRILDAATGQEIRTHQGMPANAPVEQAAGFTMTQGNRTLSGNTSGVLCAAFSADGKRLAAGSGLGTIRVLDTTTGEEIALLRQRTGVGAVTFSLDATRIYSCNALVGDANEEIRAWDITAGQETFSLRGHTSGVWGVVFSPDGKRLATSSEDKTIRVWDTATRSELVTLRGHTEEVLGIAFSPNGDVIASASADGTVRLWNTATATELQTLTGHEGRVHCVAFTPDGTLLASAGQDKTVRLWDAATGDEIRTLNGHADSVLAVAFSKDGEQLASGSSDHTVRLWITASGTELPVPMKQCGHVYHLAFGVAGQEIACACRPGDIECELSFGNSLGGRSWFGASRGHSWNGTSGEGMVSIRNVVSGEELLALKGPAGPIFCSAFSPDGNRLATTTKTGVVIWDAHTGHELFTLDGGTRGVAFSRDGNWIAAATIDGRVKVWDATVTPDLVYSRKASDLVQRLFDELLLREDVLDALAKDAELNDEYRNVALHIAERYELDVEKLNAGCWAIIRTPTQNEESCQRALRMAEMVCQLAPAISSLRVTLGVAQYRRGAYEDALQSLALAEKLNAATRQPQQQPTRLVFMAMTQHRLGQTDQSQSTLVQFKQLLETPQWVNSEQARAFLVEAEALMGTAYQNGFGQTEASGEKASEK